MLAPRQRVHHAVERPARAHAGNAAVAGDAAAHGLCRFHFAGPFGIGEQGSAEGDEVAGNRTGKAARCGFDRLCARQAAAACARRGASD